MVRSDLKTREPRSKLVLIITFLYEMLLGLIIWLIPRALLPKKNVKDQVILITGSASGIGQLMAIRFYNLGCRLVLWDVNEKGLNDTVDLILGAEKKKNDDAKKRIWTYKMDLSNRESIYQTANSVLKDVGPVDIVINNAGVVSGKLLLDTPDEKIDLTFKVNTLSHFYVLKAFLPSMIERKRGHFVTVASVAGLIGSSHLVDYCASKFANVGMNSSLKLEFALANLDFIKTSIANPYFIRTGMFEGADPGLFSFLEPEYVADKIVEGVLLELEEIEIPGYIPLLIRLFRFFPSRIEKTAYDFFGGYTMMKSFVGRHHEVNNNINNKH